MDNDATYIAIDWSGAKNNSSQRSAIWLAQFGPEGLERVRPGFTREAVVDELILICASQPDLVVGLDFGFSFPSEALSRVGADSAFTLWETASDMGESWIDGSAHDESNYPFEDLLERGGDALLRRTEMDVKRRFHPWGKPRSTVDFRARTGNVGRQSLRGFPALRRLRENGFSIWPFDEFRPPAVVEIYPRTLRPVVCRGDVPPDIDLDRDDVIRELEDQSVPYWATELAKGDLNAFDALVSVLAMKAQLGDGPSFPSEEIYLSEGRIWLPERAY